MDFLGVNAADETDGCRDNGCSRRIVDRTGDLHFAAVRIDLARLRLRCSRNRRIGLTNGADQAGKEEGEDFSHDRMFAIRSRRGDRGLMLSDEDNRRRRTIVCERAWFTILHTCRDAELTKEAFGFTWRRRRFARAALLPASSHCPLRPLVRSASRLRKEVGCLWMSRPTDIPSLSI